MIVIYLLPFINIFYQNYNGLFVINLITISLMVISYIPTAKFYGLSFVFYLSLPISSVIYMLMTISSAYNYYFRSGNIWKGRRY